MSLERWQELAREMAKLKHDDHFDGHDGHWFDACPHPDCVLVRSALPPPPEGWLDTVTRLEVVNESGRCFTRWDCVIEPSVQDQGRTLKLFVTALPPPPGAREP